MRTLTLLLPLLAASTACRSAPKLNESQEYFMGRAVAALAIEKSQLYTSDAALERYVSLVGHSVAFESDRPETYKGYTFGVLDADEPNAFCAPSGFIFVTKGLLKQMKSEDELAGVLAHEIAHVALRHPEIAVVVHPRLGDDEAGVTLADLAAGDAKRTRRHRPS